VRFRKVDGVFYDEYRLIQKKKSAESAPGLGIVGRRRAGLKKPVQNVLQRKRRKKEGDPLIEVPA